MEEENDNVCIAKLFDLKGKKKSKKRKAKKEAETVAVDSTIVVVSANKGGGANTSNGATISLFDFSVENFFRDMDTIARLCRDEEEECDTAIEQSEIQRMSSFITFLREWRDFKYQSRTIRFAYGLGSSECYEGKDVSAINLPQFSSTTVPKHDMQRGEELEDAKSQESRDFVMNVGGPVWALDWCPRRHEDPDCSIKCELQTLLMDTLTFNLETYSTGYKRKWDRSSSLSFGACEMPLTQQLWCHHVKLPHATSLSFIAVAAHPPGSSYHKMGASLTGRGVVQIWCLLNIREHTEEISSLTEKRKKRPKKDGVTNNKSTQMKRPRGRPRKNPTVTAVDDTNCETQYMPSLTVQFSENSTESPAPDGTLENYEEISFLTEKRKEKPKKDEGKNDKSTQIKRPRGRPRKNPTVIAVDDTNCETQYMLPLTVQFAENSTKFPAPDENLENNEEISSLTEKRKEKPKKDEGTNDKSSQMKRPRGRPRKNPTVIAVDDTNCETQYMPSLAVQCAENSTEFPAPDGNLENSGEIFPIPNKRKRGPKKIEAMKEKSSLMVSDRNCEKQFVPLAVQVPEDSAKFISPDGAHGNCNEHTSQQYSDTKRKHANRAASACNSKTLVKRNRLKINHKEERYNHDLSQPQLMQCENETNHQPHCSSEFLPPAATCSIPGDLTLPRVVSCLAHNGKVAWDVKWRPLNISDSLCKHRMGYLAVLLGNGSLEVWEVPLPHVLREIYMHREGTDPRFVKLEPVFKCSKLKRGSFQSIPLTMEWSVTPLHDYLLAGCHDGT
ncbi:AT hook, DNA-binding motif, partial [Sesbania bispinosa]